MIFLTIEILEHHTRINKLGNTFCTNFVWIHPKLDLFLDLKALLFSYYFIVFRKHFDRTKTTFQNSFGKEGVPLQLHRLQCLLNDLVCARVVYMVVKCWCTVRTLLIIDQLYSLRLACEEYVNSNATGAEVLRVPRKYHSYLIQIIRVLRH